MDKLYRENQQTIKKMSSKISAITGIEREELESQANLIFCECAERYSESKGDFSKYLTNALYFALYRYAKNERENIDHEDESHLYNVGTNDYSDIVQATFNNLSSDAEYVKALIFDSGKRIESKVYKSTRITKRKLQGYLRNEGWTFPRIYSAFSEIKECVMGV